MMAQVARAEEIPVRVETDVVLVRQAVRTWAVQQGFTLVDQTKIVTAASEIARNTVIYGRGGIARLEALVEGARKGLRLIFEDHGPGIGDVEMALRDGFTSGSGLGMGLGGARRLVNEFAIDSKPGVGTKVTLTRWK
jgi:serine/threonine-protein kinase RsbT